MQHTHIRTTQHTPTHAIQRNVTRVCVANRKFSNLSRNILERCFQLYKIPENHVFFVLEWSRTVISGAQCHKALRTTTKTRAFLWIWIPHTFISK
jgi:hypothetical protein